MSQEKGVEPLDERPELAEAVSRTTDAFNRGDFDTAAAYYAKDAVWDLSQLGLGVYEGREAIRILCEQSRTQG